MRGIVRAGFSSELAESSVYGPRSGFAIKHKLKDLTVSN
jgi:hypothetical protein